MNSYMKSQVRLPQGYSVPDHKLPRCPMTVAQNRIWVMGARLRIFMLLHHYSKTPPLVASEEIFKIASMAPGALLLEAQKEYEVSLAYF